MYLENENRTLAGKKYYKLHRDKKTCNRVCKIALKSIPFVTPKRCCRASNFGINVINSMAKGSSERVNEARETKYLKRYLSPTTILLQSPFRIKL